MAETVSKNIVVKGTPEDLYAAWSKFENFPHFMEYIESVTVDSSGISHWMMKGPLGTEIKWDAEVTRAEPGKRIAWRSIESDDQNIKTSGQVTFNELPHGETEISVTMGYVPPPGLASKIVAALFTDPEGRLERDLKNFKQYVEDSRYARTPNRQ